MLISRKIRGLVAALIIGAAVMLPLLRLYAHETDPKLSLNANDKDRMELEAVAGKVIDANGEKFLTIGHQSIDSSNYITVTLNMTDYAKLEQGQKKDVMNRALRGVQNCGASTITRNKVYNFIESQDESTASLVRQLSDDVNADFASAYTLFKPFSGKIGTVLGVFAMVIFITLTLMILTDISFITIPIIRSALSPSSSQGRPKFVSNEAWYAVKESEEAANTSKNTLGLYFKKKTMQFITLSICLLYLLSGRIYQLVGMAMDTFGEILKK